LSSGGKKRKDEFVKKQGVARIERPGWGGTTEGGNFNLSNKKKWVAGPGRVGVRRLSGAIKKKWDWEYTSEKRNYKRTKNGARKKRAQERE